LGRAFPQYTALPPRSERVASRLAAFERQHGHVPTPVVRSKIEAQEARKERRAVAGYDLVFTPVKSASLLWALGSTHTRAAVDAAHHEAVANTLAWLEQETAFARVGDHGEQQIETRGFLAAAFDHRDSRAGDPDLHTHLAISNKVRARDDYPDGRPRWLSLDARVIHAAAVAASERYNTRLEDGLARRLGVTFVERRDSVRGAKRVVREVHGVPDQLIRHFSKRRAAIEDRYRDLASWYRHTHGHEPPRETQLKLAQQATLESRDAKQDPQTLAECLRAWRQEAADVVGRHSLARLEDRTLGTATVGPVDPVDLDIDVLAQEVATTVSSEKATWTRWNVLAETERRLRPIRFTSPVDREAATDQVITRVLDPQFAVQLTTDGLATATTVPGQDVAATDRRSNGESVLVEHGSARYTTQDLLDAEQRLLDHAQQPTRYALTAQRISELLTSFEQHHQVQLDGGQRALVSGFTTNSRRLVVGIGPAGAGKTTAMKAVAEAWRTTGGRVIPLAPSAAAADVLGSELGCRAENLHKFRHRHENRSGRGKSDDWFVLRPGDLVLVDEAGMAGTRNLDWLTTYTRERGAVVRLLGDPAQLSSVEACGALRLLANDVGAVELTDLHRFTDPDEAAATLGLRDGRAEALDYYFDRERVRHGSNDAMREAAYEAWAADTGAGHTSLLIAGSRTEVAALNTRARVDRIHHGVVQPDGVDLSDGTRAGGGDIIVTRRNERRLTNRAGTKFVQNGDAWTVSRRHHNGDVTVTHLDHGHRVRLPHAYVSDHVELGYATTTAQAQGRTVDTAHVLVDETTNREGLYVAATRARTHTRLYVTTERPLQLDAERPPAPATEARDQLNRTLDSQSSEISATEIRRQSSARRRPQSTPLAAHPSPLRRQRVTL
jgi:conjugative relaxase-like TrwC/TraI family protein